MIAWRLSQVEVKISRAEGAQHELLPAQVDAVRGYVMSQARNYIMAIDDDNNEADSIAQATAQSEVFVNSCFLLGADLS